MGYAEDREIEGPVSQLIEPAQSESAQPSTYLFSLHIDGTDMATIKTSDNGEGLSWATGDPNHAA